MFEDAASYPVRGEWTERTVVGSLLAISSVFIAPAVLLAGYCVRVLETTLADADEPPAFDSWRDLAVRGLGATAITVAYLVVPLLLGLLAAVIVGIIGYYGLLGLAPAIGNQTELVWGASIIAALVAAALALAFVGATLVVYYAYPAAMVAYARTGTVRTAFDRRAVAAVALTGDYFLAMAAIQLVALLVPIVAVLCVITVIGVLALPAILFATLVGCCRLIGTAAVRSSTVNNDEAERTAAAPASAVPESSERVRPR
ncbi:DUF4013 domain-containing protein [Natrialbaceae archaeon A-arb3/5]